MFIILMVFYYMWTHLVNLCTRATRNIYILQEDSHICESILWSGNEYGGVSHASALRYEMYSVGSAGTI